MRVVGRVGLVGQGLTRNQSLVEFFKESPLSELPDAAFERSADMDASGALLLNPWE